MLEVCPAGRLRAGIGLHVESCEPNRAAKQVKKRRHVARTSQLRLPLSGRGHKENAPHKNKHGRSYTKRNHIGKRIQFAAEVAGGVRHARDAAVQTVKQDRKENCFGREREVAVEPHISGSRLQCSFESLQDGDKAKKDIRASEESRQGVGSATRPFRFRALTS